ncbi:DUF1707 domain-containing protein [Planotetraspora sp. A-T 1434]|uniref:DUF1707 SHOCT-like domain-containing protein n=1 Tax=Planotetraspora sp. A-T 1434 TaxID=2979219 RepID=UPI0021BE590B|nr:DUF1707 domain-containing protein [Planotetraspora sp. A-T 1434]MCT9929452.1 DUF1707 domain-containing protein [Planotetraspora sp. A-T 1434]
MNDPGGMRASDAERESVVERLREASVEGRLTLAELTERTEAAYLAQTHAELAQITADLPGGAPAAAPQPAAPQPVAPAMRGGVRKWIVAVMGDTVRKGKWRIDEEIGAVCVMGDVTLDLRQAEVRTNQVDIVATCVMGNIKIIVPDGVDVELTGMAIMGDKKVQVVEAPSGHNAPVVRVRAYVVMGDVKVIGDSRAEPIKRAWFAWSEWWLDRREEMRHGLLGYDHQQLRHDVWQAVQDGREARREMMREGRDAQRQFMRESHQAEREIRREARQAEREIRRQARHPRRDFGDHA